MFDGLDSMQERNALNEVTASYVRDGNIGGILSRTSASGTSFFHYDGSGNVVTLSDETGALVGRYSYDAFGNTLETSGTRGQENPYRFSTKELHSQSGLYDFGYRFYSPGTGRWINRDPLEEDGGLNLYAMVENNPTNLADEYGERGVAFPGALKALKSIGIPNSRIGQIVGSRSTYSGGTHGASGRTNRKGQPYGSAIDIRVNGMTPQQIANDVSDLRSVGFAAWYRAPGGPSGSAGTGPHIHAVWSGAKTRNSDQLQQIASFLRGYKGIANADKPMSKWIDPTFKKGDKDCVLANINRLYGPNFLKKVNTYDQMHYPIKKRKR